MLFGQLRGRPIGMQNARISNHLDACCLRGIDHRSMLTDPTCDLVRRHEEEPLNPCKSRSQSVGAVVIGFADQHAQGRKVGRLFGRANRSDDFGGRDRLQQAFDDEPAELTGGTSDSVHGSSCG